jgi:hypothetical protein
MKGSPIEEGCGGKSYGGKPYRGDRKGKLYEGRPIEGNIMKGILTMRQQSIYFHLLLLHVL